MTSLKAVHSYPSHAAPVLLCALLAACGEPAPPRPAEIAEARSVAPSDPAEIARQVVADFLSIPVSETTLVSLEAKDFRDASLDCPQPGMSYAQVITPGHRVIVEADGRRFDVRVSGGHGGICHKPAGRKTPQRPGEPPPEQALPVTSQVARARADLAALLDANAADIAVLDVRRFSPAIAAPGCAPDCEGDDNGCGFLIGLFYDGRRYEYHTHDGRAVPCPPLSPA